MKKVLFAVAIASVSMVACNNADSKKDGADTTKVVVADTTKTVVAPADTTKHDTTHVVVADTAKKAK